VHLFAYVAVVLLLFFVNLTVTPKVWWFYWVALGWGAGVAAHLWCVFWKHGRGRSRTGMVATSGASQATPARTSSSGSKSRTRNATPRKSSSKARKR
jgi:2TM domain